MRKETLIISTGAHTVWKIAERFRGCTNKGHVTHGLSLKAPIPLTSISSSSRLFSTLCGFAFCFAFLQEDTRAYFFIGSDLSRNVKRIKGADRQVPIKGAWHWNAFEQEPEKTASMEVHFRSGRRDAS